MEPLRPYNYVEPPPTPAAVASATGLEHPPVTEQPVVTAHPAVPDNPAVDGGAGHRRKLGGRSAGGIGAALVAFGVKAKVILLAIIHFKFLLSAGTMLVSVLAYGSLWGFPFAAGFVALLLVHEMGHVIQLRREGIKSSLPMFIPFLGAVVSARLTDGDAATEARVGIAGPILGSLGALVCFALWKETGNDIWRALAYAGFLINLFNLIPILPLDGGRVMAAMTPVMWFVGFAVLIAVAFIAYSPIFLLILVVGAFETVQRWRQYRHPNPATQAYYKVAATDRILLAAVYIALIALLAVGMHAAYVPRTL